MQYLAGGRSFTSDMLGVKNHPAQPQRERQRAFPLFPKLVANLNLRAKTEVEKQLRMRGMFSTVFIAAFQPLPCVSR